MTDQKLLIVILHQPHQPHIAQLLLVVHDATRIFLALPQALVPGVVRREVVLEEVTPTLFLNTLTLLTKVQSRLAIVVHHTSLIFQRLSEFQNRLNLPSLQLAAAAAGGLVAEQRRVEPPAGEKNDGRKNHPPTCVEGDVEALEAREEEQERRASPIHVTHLHMIPVEPYIVEIGCEGLYYESASFWGPRVQLKVSAERYEGQRQKVEWMILHVVARVDLPRLWWK